MCTPQQKVAHIGPFSAVVNRRTCLHAFAEMSTPATEMKG